jgi:hypothetical protein
VAVIGIQLAAVVCFNLLVFRDLSWPISAYASVPISVLLLLAILDHVTRFLREPKAVIAHDDTLEIQWRRGRSLTANVDEIEILKIDRQAFHHLFDHIVIRAGNTEFTVFGDAINYKDLLDWLDTDSPRRK